MKMIRHSVEINGINVEAVYSEREVNEVFLPLLRKLTGLQAEKGRRILAMLAAPPGAGKTTLLSFLQRLSGEHEDVGQIQVIGMDGFHRRQEGAPDTFDLEKLTENVRRVASGEIFGWPAYDRMLHNPVENAVEINNSIILLEGNYLLLDADGWRNLSSFADFTISVRAEETLLRTRLIDRRIKTGVEREAAIRFVDFSDMPNVRLCLKKTMRADLELMILEDGRFDHYKNDGADESGF